MSSKPDIARRISPVFPAFLILYEVALYLSTDAYLPALPSISRDLHLGQQVTQLTLTVWFLGSASLQLVFGPLADHFGRRPFLLGSGYLFLLATVGCAAPEIIPAPPAAILLVCRFIQGATVTSMIVAGYATIHDLFHKDRAIHVLAVMNSIAILAPAFGPLLGALVVMLSGWRWIFYGLAIWAFCALAGLYFTMPESSKKEPSVQRDFSIKKTLRDYRIIFSNLKFLRYILVAGCLFASMIVWITASPFLLIEGYGMSEIEYAVIQAVVFGGFIIGTRCVKVLMRHYTLETIVTFNLGLGFIGSLFMLFAALLHPTSYYPLVAAMTSIAFGTGMPLPILNRLSVESSTAPMGSRVAVYSFALSLSGTCGSMLVASDQKAYDAGAALYLAIALVGLSAVANGISIFFRRQR